MPNATTSRRAYAKLNLMLSVGQALPAEHEKAGYHPICSWFSCIDLFDDITVEPSKGTTSKYNITWADDAVRKSDIDWPIEKDLAVRAHKALEAIAKKPLPITLTLHKRIPVGGGLGGGSSDAAACLLAVRKAFSLDIDDEALRDVAMTLGSDVAFFLDDEHQESDDTNTAARSAIVSGLGEVIERVEAIDYPIILVVPHFGCATGAVYKSFDETLEAELREYRLDRAVAAEHGQNLGRERSTGPREQMVQGRVERMIREGKLDTDLLFSDLAKPAFAVEPRLGQLVTNLSNVTRSAAHVTGSGSCVFLVPRRGKEDWMLERVHRVCDTLGSEPDFGGTPSVILTNLVG